MSIDLYSTVYRVDRSVRSHTFRKITRDQIHVTKVGTGTCIETSKPINSTKNPYGYIASISKSMSSSDLIQSLSMYDVTEDGAVSKTLMYANSGYKGLSHRLLTLIGVSRIPLCPLTERGHPDNAIQQY